MASACCCRGQLSETRAIHAWSRDMIVAAPHARGTARGIFHLPACSGEWLCFACASQFCLGMQGRSFWCLRAFRIPFGDHPLKPVQLFHNQKVMDTQA